MQARHHGEEARPGDRQHRLDLVQDGRAARAHLLGLPQQRDRRQHLALASGLFFGRRLDVIAVADKLTQPSQELEDRPAPRLCRVGGEDGHDAQVRQECCHVRRRQIGGHEVKRLADRLAERPVGQGHLPRA